MHELQGSTPHRVRACMHGDSRVALCADALEVGGNLVESAANLVPESVPRGVAKGGVAVAGVLVAFWVLQKVRLCVLGGGGTGLEGGHMRIQAIPANRTPQQTGQ